MRKRVRTLIRRCNMQILRNVLECGGTRQSNIEALRLLSMLMVLNLHSFWGYEHGSGVGQAFDFFRESTSICAVNVFLLVSGYFGIKWKWKSFYNLVFQILFYSFGVYLVACAIGVVDFSIRAFLSNIHGLYAFWGFITWYVLLYFCAPFLNAFIENSENKQILITILIIWVAENFICRGSDFLNYGLLYLIGRFLSKAQCVNNLQIKASHSYWITTFLIFAIVFVLFKFTKVKDAEAMTTMLIGYSYAAPLVILQAVFLFLVFARMQFMNRFINWCASSCLAIFLIHMHPSIKQIGFYSITESFYNLPVIKHVIYLFLLISCVFWGCILIDKIRIIISDFVYVILNKMIFKIPAKLLRIDTYLPKSLIKIL